VAFSFYLFSLLRKERCWAIYGTRADVTVTTTKNENKKRRIIMDYFSTEFILFCGIIIGVALTISMQQAWKEMFKHD
jgi:hypothetical protein